MPDDDVEAGPAAGAAAPEPDAAGTASVTPVRGDEALEAAAALEDDRPLVVLGNCQAEALRLLVSGEASGTASPRVPPSVRLPPVFELTEADLPALRRLVSRASALVMQPVRDDYRGLPIGTNQIAALLPPGAAVVRVPVLRDSALFPWQVTIRGAGHEAADPPVVPYHDLRTVAEAAAALRGERVGSVREQRLTLEASTVRELAEASLEELRTRERAHGTVVVSDWLREVSSRTFHTINHPTVAVLTRVAGLVREALGIDEPVAPPSPERVMLSGIDAPVEEQIVEALGLDVAPHAHWRIGSDEVADAEIRDAHLAWYATRPDVVENGVTRHADRLRALGLTP